MERLRHPTLGRLVDRRISERLGATGSLWDLAKLNVLTKHRKYL